MDRISKGHRSWNMSRIRSRDTQPERMVRSMLHRQGLRFRVNVRSLPGSPDIVLSRYRCVVFVHGCFWHRHQGCKYTTTPKTRSAFWQHKFAANIARDIEVRRKLRQLGWRVCLIWQCEIRSSSVLQSKVNAVVRQITLRRR
jgi:DNA mismatch endonuclease (patch repair protein)